MTLIFDSSPGTSSARLGPVSIDLENSIGSGFRSYVVNSASLSSIELKRWETVKTMPTILDPKEIEKRRMGKDLDLPSLEFTASELIHFILEKASIFEGGSLLSEAFITGGGLGIVIGGLEDLRVELSFFVESEDFEVCKHLVHLFLDEQLKKGGIYLDSAEKDELYLHQKTLVVNGRDRFSFIGLGNISLKFISPCSRQGISLSDKLLVSFERPIVCYCVDHESFSFDEAQKAYFDLRHRRLSVKKPTEARRLLFYILKKASEGFSVDDETAFPACSRFTEDFSLRDLSTLTKEYISHLRRHYRNNDLGKMVDVMNLYSLLERGLERGVRELYWKAALKACIYKTQMKELVVSSAFASLLDRNPQVCSHLLSCMRAVFLSEHFLGNQKVQAYAFDFMEPSERCRFYLSLQDSREERRYFAFLPGDKNYVLESFLQSISFVEKGLNAEDKKTLQSIMGKLGFTFPFSEKRCKTFVQSFAREALEEASLRESLSKSLPKMIKDLLSKGLIEREWVDGILLAQGLARYKRRFEYLGEQSQAKFTGRMIQALFYLPEDTSYFLRLYETLGAEELQKFVGDRTRDVAFTNMAIKALLLLLHKCAHPDNALLNFSAERLFLALWRSGVLKIDEKQEACRHLLPTYLESLPVYLEREIEGSEILRVLLTDPHLLEVLSDKEIYKNFMLLIRGNLFSGAARALIQSFIYRASHQGIATLEYEDEGGRQVQHDLLFQLCKSCQDRKESDFLQVVFFTELNRFLTISLSHPLEKRSQFLKRLEGVIACYAALVNQSVCARGEEVLQVLNRLKSFDFIEDRVKVVGHAIHAQSWSGGTQSYELFFYFLKFLTPQERQQLFVSIFEILLHSNKSKSLKLAQKFWKEMEMPGIVMMKFLLTLSFHGSEERESQQVIALLLDRISQIPKKEIQVGEYFPFLKGLITRGGSANTHIARRILSVFRDKALLSDEDHHFFSGMLCKQHMKAHDLETLQEALEMGKSLLASEPSKNVGTPQEKIIFFQTLLERVAASGSPTMLQDAQAFLVYLLNKNHESGQALACLIFSSYLDQSQESSLEPWDRLHQLVPKGLLSSEKGVPEILTVFMRIFDKNIHDLKKQRKQIERASSFLFFVEAKFPIAKWPVEIQRNLLKLASTFQQLSDFPISLKIFSSLESPDFDITLHFLRGLCQKPTERYFHLVEREVLKKDLIDSWTPDEKREICIRLFRFFSKIGLQAKDKRVSKKAAEWTEKILEKDKECFSPSQVDSKMTLSREQEEIRKEAVWIYMATEDIYYIEMACNELTTYPFKDFNELSLQLFATCTRIPLEKHSAFVAGSLSQLFHVLLSQYAFDVFNLQEWTSISALLKKMYLVQSPVYMHAANDLFMGISKTEYHKVLSLHRAKLPKSKITRQEESFIRWMEINKGLYSQVFRSWTNHLEGKAICDIFHEFSSYIMSDHLLVDCHFVFITHLLFTKRVSAHKQEECEQILGGLKPLLPKYFKYTPEDLRSLLIGLATLVSSSYPELAVSMDEILLEAEASNIFSVKGQTRKKADEIRLSVENVNFHLVAAFLKHRSLQAFFCAVDRLGKLND